MKKIILTGGGTAGHVTPNIALIPALKQLGYEISYIGSYTGIEKGLIEQEGIPYYAIDSGKLRRYFDIKNFSDPFHVVHGFAQAELLLRKLKPDVVFSKGGFVSVPVVLAAKTLKIPAIIHESDMTPGLANKLSFPSSVKVCCNFPETVQYLPEGKGVHTGTPIREQLLAGDPEKARSFCGLSGTKPVLMIIGGSQGSVAVNQAVRRILPRLLEKFQVIHLCGKGHLESSLDHTEGYRQYEYIREQLPDLFALADVVISRAGANAIFELLSLRKCALLIPLPSSSSRGDQLLNAESFRKQGFSEVLKEEEITDDLLFDSILHLYENRQKYIDAMSRDKSGNAIRTIVDLIEETVAKGHTGT